MGGLEVSLEGIKAEQKSKVLKIISAGWLIDFMASLFLISQRAQDWATKMIQTILRNLPEKLPKSWKEL
jgi:hypothetical protein